FEALVDLSKRALAADFEQGMAGESGVPHRRIAGLAIGLLVPDNQELLDRESRDRTVRMIRRIAERVEHHDIVDHRREDRADAVLAVEMLDRERHRVIDRALADALGNQRIDDAQNDIDAAEEGEPPAVLLRRARREPGVLRRLEEQLVDPQAL